MEVRVSRETTVSVVRAWCRRSGTMGRGARGRPLPSDTLPPPPLCRPVCRVGQAHLSQGVGQPQAATHELTGRDGRYGRRAATAAVRAGGAPCVETLLGSCATRGERLGRRAPPCRARPVPAPPLGCAAASRMQPSRRSGAAFGRHSPPPRSALPAVGDVQGLGSESGARAVVSPKGRGAGRTSACARAGVSGVVECCASSE